ncbi:Group ii intron reverse transcriptase maturase [Caligus rogercresseyi]|uniref:Group ii intron reverse transcriptase maturase n=1 Tax=Caligus rogercresseyi TaxID=217165 RepID=A0A7T8GL12_CALRO|nr:Group ii intron reverse transcriptase maturase [Caligus rogercresseyi]
MSKPGPSKTKDRTMESFFSEAGALYQFPDDNGTLHVGLKEADFPRVIYGFKNDAFADDVAAHSPTILQKVLIGGGVSAGECGLIALAERRNGSFEADGDIRFSKNPPIPTIPFGKEITRDILSLSNRSRGLTLVAATKILWWNTNHHTGDFNAGANNLVGKVIRVADIVPGEITAEELMIVHMAGHWISTIATLKKLGFPGLRQTRPLVKDPRSVTLLEDFELRLAGPPAGTAKLALPVVVFESMAASPIMATCPNLAEIVAAIKMWRDVHEETYSSYHVGATYLTGRDRIPSGSLVTHLMKNSTLAASPLFTRKGVFSAARDYSPEFDKACAKFDMAMMTSDEAQIAQLSDLVAHKRLSRPEINERCKALGLPDISQADYDRQIQQASTDTGAKRRREASEEARTAKSSRVSADTSDSDSTAEEGSEPETPTACRAMLPREKLNYLIQFTSGHCLLRRHYHLMHPKVSPLCRGCGQADEDPLHLANESLLLDNSRAFQGYSVLDLAKFLANTDIGQWIKKPPSMYINQDGLQ